MFWSPVPSLKGGSRDRERWRYGGYAGWSSSWSVRKLLGEAVGHLRGLPGAERVAAFEKFAEPITTANNGQWNAKSFNAINARVFAGEGGEALVFDSAGNMFRVHLSDRAAFAFRGGGQIEVIFNALRGL